jgi:3',5'-cyclic AMP phosphodiesterase CpdA
MRIALIADTHLSARSPECVANWHAARRAIARIAPDRTVHLGDITLDGQKHPEELAFAAQLVAQWPTAVHCLPGNHDMGDASGESPLDPRLLATYKVSFGPDHWSITTAGWQLLGINAQLLGSGSPQEAAQWRWLEDRAASAEARAHTALFLHRPTVRLQAGESNRTGRYIASAACDRLLHGPLQQTLRLVVSGHTHQYLDVASAGVRHVWMPSSAFILPDDLQARIGEKVVGIGVLDFSGDSVGFDLWCPDGMMRYDLSAMPVFHEMADGARSSPAT